MQHIVLLEDDVLDAELIERTLARNDIQVAIDVADSRRRFEQLLGRTKVDLVISDSAVNGFTALEALALTKVMQPQSGFIIVSGGINEERADQARRMGALEWVRKDNLVQLPPLVRMALEAAEEIGYAAYAETDREAVLADRATRRLVQAVTELSKARDLETIQKIVRCAAREINGADGAAFVLRDGESCHYLDEDAIQPLWKGRRFPIATCVSGWAMIHRRPAVIPDITADARIPQDAYRATFVKSLIMVPIRSDAPIGAIGNYWSVERVPTEAEVRFIQALADATSVALENVQVHRDLENRVARRTQQLLEANRSLEEFSYFVSHDLRAPIRHVGAFAALLEEELVAVPPAAQRSIDKIKSSVTTMNAMLEGLLALAQLGVQTVDLHEVDMNALARDVAQLAREESDLPIEVTIADLPATRGSEALLRQVWTNLVANAIKFSSKRITPMISIGAHRKEGEIRYFVRDNGVGFEMADANQLFDAFRRLHSEKDYPGNGVGLAIVNRIVSRHGGRVWAESQPDRGATFFFTLSHDDTGACDDFEMEIQ
jgi:signal transduction histidine kinase/DNA-binding NarL/FixJ family response regulator